MTDQNSLEANEAPVIKKSNNPRVQERVELEIGKLQQKNSSLTESHATQHARDRVAAEIVRERLRGELEHAKKLAYLDALTGLHNRRWFEEDLDRRIAHARRVEKDTGIKQSFWVLYIDWDKFKLVNDLYSHASGDSALKLAANLPFREDEPLARIGGEEFAQAMNQDITIKDIPLVMTRYMDSLKIGSTELFRRLNQQKKLPYREKLRRLTFSFGAAQWVDEDREALMEKADLATKHAKEKGRDTGYVAHRTKSGHITFLKINKVKTA